MLKSLRMPVLFTILSSSMAFPTTAPSHGGRSTQMTIAGVVWNLATRVQDPQTHQTYEVWEDTNTGLDWGDVLPKRYSFDEAVDVARTGNVVYSELACHSETAKLPDGKITDKVFGVPTPLEVTQAHRDGMGEVLSHANDSFWTASQVMGNWDRAISYSPKEGIHRSGYGWREPLAVRCVGRAHAGTKISSTGVAWHFVTSVQDNDAGKTYEIWEDTKTGLYWGSRFPEPLRMDLIYQNDQRFPKERYFGEPAARHVADAHKDGLNEIVPDADISLVGRFPSQLNDYSDLSP